MKTAALSETAEQQPSAPSSKQAPATPKRTWYPTKEAWARAEAQKYRDGMADLRHQSSHGSYGRAAGKYESLRLMEEAAQRFERMADKYAKLGQ